LTPEEALSALLAQLPRPIRDVEFLRDLDAQDRVHRRERKPGSLTVVFHWDDQGNPVKVTAQPSPAVYPLDADAVKA